MVDSSPHKPKSTNRGLRDLKESASVVSNNLIRLGRLQQFSQGVSEDRLNYKEPQEYRMALPVTIEWNGPLTNLVKKAAKISGYSFAVFGKPPIIPIFVMISVKNTFLGDILADAGYQAGKRATIVIYPKIKQINLYYHND